MSADPVIMPVRPGSLAQEDIDALRTAGVIVIFHDDPDSLRLLRPMSELDGGDLLRCAMSALLVETGTYGNDQRQAFTKAVAKAIMAKPKDGAA